MATASHTVEVNVPQKDVWEFVSKMENWATLVPGYREHEMMDEQHSNWTFAGNVGVLKKEVKVEITITSWDEPNKISFTLTGLTDKFTGNGYFEGEAISEEKTKMTGYLEVKAGGFAAPVLNPIFQAVLPKATSMLTNRVANRIGLVHV
ncbi:SRPBCC family protein [Rummeliibacillus sp. G93]|uniref:CoxG family protein n=1 Tax=Rummeliibacillus TaxID=648802 RepID=UPI001172708A|nr:MULTISPECIES: SRPBCC family protein [Rummeliibacillus]MBB5169383.1 carbon monoxide dehydrogenase subunit G [Rummeliibacillus stabekisii]UQW98867.1 SRPBCC family protein [Rummeliibacillus sp. G93]GEL03644.1 hypothetical protein RST01_02710 [Rummeliibacillus stabekisii]